MQNLHHLHFIVFSQDQPKLARSPLLLIFHAPPVTEEKFRDEQHVFTGLMSLLSPRHFHFQNTDCVKEQQ